MIKRIISKTLLHFGYSVSRIDSMWMPGKTYWQAGYLRRLGFCVNTIFDIGVGALGTPELYKAFPDAFFVLIDPLQEFEATMQNILKTHKGCYFLTALGSQKETRAMYINQHIKERSSMHDLRGENLSGPKDQRDVVVTTLDSLFQEYNFRPPFGLKIDTEGCEYQIIESGQNILKQTDFVIAEVSVAKRHKQGYTFEDFIVLMKKNGFCVCDILDIGRGQASEVTFFDLVFKRS